MGKTVQDPGTDTAAGDDRHPSSHMLGRLLDLIAQILDGSGSEFAPEGRRLRDLHQRLRDERFHLAVLGQFKRGKSTFLNALLAEELLPASVVPLTAIPTFIHWGDQLGARVIYLDEHDGEEYVGGKASDLASFLSRYVTEESNPNNRLRVAHVEVSYPSPILSRGVVLIDTPGIGSTFRHNTEATLNFLPQCDAALFIVSADPPITEVEVDFLREVRARMSRVFYVLNKIDYLNKADQEKALSFLREVLSQQVGIDAAPVFSVSARLGLEARVSGNDALWEGSGLKDVEERLVDFLTAEKTDALREAIARRASGVVADSLMRLDLSLQSLRMPLEDLERKMRSLETKLEEVKHRRVSEADMLEGDRKRMAALLEEQAEQLRRKARTRLGRIVSESLERSGPPDEAAIQSALADAVPVFFEHELGEMSQVFEQQVRLLLHRHQESADLLVDSVRKVASELFDIPYREGDNTEGFEFRKRLHWVTHQWNYSLSLLPEGFIDKLLPMGIRKARAKNRLMDRIESLVAQNVESVRWPTLQNLNETFRRFGSSLDQRLEEVISSIRGAIEGAYTRRKEESDTAGGEIARLESYEATLRDIAARLKTCCEHGR